MHIQRIWPPPRPILKSWLHRWWLKHNNKFFSTNVHQNIIIIGLPGWQRIQNYVVVKVVVIFSLWKVGLKMSSSQFLWLITWTGEEINKQINYAIDSNKLRYSKLHCINQYQSFIIIVLSKNILFWCISVMWLWKRTESHWLHEVNKNRGL